MCKIDFVASCHIAQYIGLGDKGPVVQIVMEGWEA
jgi:hypothetical protein